jgi:hypothetical protein
MVGQAILPDFRKTGFGGELFTRTFALAIHHLWYHGATLLMRESLLVSKQCSMIRKGERYVSFYSC